MKGFSMVRQLAIVTLGALALGQELPAQEISTSEIIARSVEAMGGAERIENWETLRIRYNLPDHEGTSLTEIRRPNLFRAVDGILLPWAFTYPGRQGEVLTAWVEEVEVNPPLPGEHFRIPGGSG